MLQYVMMFLLFVVGLLLILLILVQRGKGGGLAGALGGMGGQSAFGTKAGDTFTKITIGMAALWIVLCVASVRLLAPTTKFDAGMGGGKAAQSGEEKPGGDSAGEPAKSETPPVPAE